LFEAAPWLKRWRYYCYYCLQATLVLLTKVIDEPLAKETEDIVQVCELSVNIFGQIDLKAAKRCAEIVAGLIERWRRHRTAGETSLEDSWVTLNSHQKATQPPETMEKSVPVQISEPECLTLSTDLSSAAQQELAQRNVAASPYGISPDSFNTLVEATHLDPMPESEDVNFPFTDDLWTYFADTETHSRSFESWMDILTAS
jgi:hypothetical protein